MALQYDGRSLVPDLTQSLNMALGIGQQLQDKRNQQEVMELQGQIGEQGATDFLSTPEGMQTVTRMMQLDPQAGQAVLGILQSRDMAQMEQAAQEAEEAQNVFRAIYHMDDPDERRSIIIDQARRLQKEGKDNSKLMEMLQLSPEEQRVRALRNMMVAGDISALAGQKRQTAKLGPDDTLFDVNTGQVIASGAQQGANEKDELDAQLKRQQLALREAEERRKQEKSEREAKAAEAQEAAAKDAQSRALDVVEQLLDKENIDATKRAFGTVDRLLPTMRQGTANVEAKLEELESILTAENLDMMTGVLSESDVKMLRQIAAGGLNRKLGDKQAIKNLKQLKASLSRKLGKSTTASIEDLVNQYAD